MNTMQLQALNIARLVQAGEMEIDLYEEALLLRIIAGHYCDLNDFYANEVESRIAAWSIMLSASGQL